ncbi:unnamed protein product [Durusdinium trenchii]|uniref:Methyltransferase type 11 domain-containing protein n=2 Tax=Durusdinium trenchii TaxID=1381693 RepID=A0ABP0H688_9DINO
MAATWIARAQQLTAQARHRLEVEEEFDEYAEEFEEHLVTVLDYKLPEILATKLAHHASLESEHLAQPRRVVDLGCGTGLCGRAIRRLLGESVELIGVDLSACMLARAKEDGAYDALFQRDLLAHLERHERAEAVDVLLAADVLIYVEHLEKVFREAHRVLKRGGWFLFSTELALDTEVTEGRVVRESGRIAHSRGYIEALASEHSLAVLEAETIPLRIVGA